VPRCLCQFGPKTQVVVASKKSLRTSSLRWHQAPRAKVRRREGIKSRADMLCALDVVAVKSSQRGMSKVVAHGGETNFSRARVACECLIQCRLARRSFSASDVLRGSITSEAERA